MTIKKIFEGWVDEEVHSDFLKFGRGSFENRYLIEGKKQIGKWTIKTSAEFANFFVRKCLEKVSGGERIQVKGVIIATFDLSKEAGFEIEKVGNFQGIRKHIVDAEVSADEILNLMKKYPRAFFGLSFSAGDCVLKIKAKAPKSGKAGKSSDEAPKADFCNLKTSDSELVRDLFFDIGLNWKEIKINHTIVVEEIVYPENMEGMKPEEVRERSKRKGRVVRKVEVDGAHKESEAEFEA